ncbi:glycosyl hydrolase family 8 [Amycolatopsis sp. NPDC051061]|uniref:glycosyl hydrolase family 8 n=1 Tax=Amycolatopsis sp. NPDC051061 TaxID=3155042 RepID=UPI00342E34F0
MNLLSRSDCRRRSQRCLSTRRTDEENHPRGGGHGSDSATDGDLEIAYGLLVADKKWGSTGSVNYKTEAVRIINAIKKSEIDNSTKFTLLGDWGNDAEYKNSSRSSDWMPGHLRAFAKATGDSFWDQVRTRSETAVSRLQSQYAPNTGLLPDFVVTTNSTPKPAPADFLEGEYDGKYSWNACRDPWPGRGRDHGFGERGDGSGPQDDHVDQVRDGRRPGEDPERLLAVGLEDGERPAPVLHGPRSRWRR